VARAEALVVV